MVALERLAHKKAWQVSCPQVMATAHLASKIHSRVETAYRFLPARIAPRSECGSLSILPPKCARQRNGTRSLHAGLLGIDLVQEHFERRSLCTTFVSVH
jgi:hypothetical protein